MTGIRYGNVRYAIWLAVAIFVLFVYQLQGASGSTYYTLLTQSDMSIETPLVILEDGTANISTVYTNGTSAKISVDANSTQLTYNYSLNIINNDVSLWEVRLEEFYKTDINRVNATVILHNNSSLSEQIIISGGNLTQANSYYNLINNTTIHIGIMNLIENTEGTTILDIYLRIKTPNTTTYTLYVITFEFT